MADSFTSYTVDNDKRFRKAMENAAAVSQDLRVPFGLILRDFYKSEQSIFKLKGPGKYPEFKNSARATSTGGKNNPNGKRGTEFTATMSPYQKYKLKRYGFDYPLLVRTGALAASILGPNSKGSVSKITNLSLVFGTSIAYGKYHQSDDPRKKVPLRKFLFIGPEASEFATSEQMGRLERWLNYINDHVVKTIQKGLA